MNNQSPNEHQNPLTLPGLVTLQIDPSYLLQGNVLKAPPSSEKKSVLHVTPSEPLKVEFKDRDVSADAPSLFPSFSPARSGSDMDRVVTTLVGFIGIVVLGFIFFLLFRAETKQVNKVVPDSFVNANAAAVEQQARASVMTALDEGISIEDQEKGIQQKIDALHSRKLEESGVKTAKAPTQLQVKTQF